MIGKYINSSVWVYVCLKGACSSPDTAESFGWPEPPSVKLQAQTLQLRNLLHHDAVELFIFALSGRVGVTARSLTSDVVDPIACD